MDSNLIKLLETEKPMFHLKSLTEEVPMYVEDFFFRKRKTDTQGFTRISYAIEKDVLTYISSIVKPGFLTLETGGGYSTVIFAANARKHLCVNPDLTSNQLVKIWLQSKGYSCENLCFVEDSSDQGLATLKLSEPVDVALIDGNHCFPFPIIDWHFIDLFLKVGSKLLIDDTQINSVKILSEFLVLEPSYQKIAQIGNCAVFEKVSDIRIMGWSSQEINKRPLLQIFSQNNQEKTNLLKYFTKNRIKKLLPNFVLKFAKKMKKF